MARTTLIIPSRKERFLNNTIQDALNNATGDLEIIVVQDGYIIPDNELIKDQRVHYMHLPDMGHMQKRQGINAAVSIANGEFIMASDAHCMFGKGFDEILSRDCTDNMIMIPRRYKLEPISWTVNKEWGYVDYEYWMYREYVKGILKPYRWSRPERENIMIDDTLAFQGSCWFMRKDYFKKMGFMKIEGYTGWGQEDVELSMETYLAGGRIVVNKNTWYAHLFKGKTYGRMYHAPVSQTTETRNWAFNYWCIQRKDDFLKVLKRFAPIPNWTL
jgi:glycosyltransferase involved in cell wall biosynthesis